MTFSLRTEALIITMVVIGGFLLRVWNVSMPNTLIFDEFYFVEQARGYFTGTFYMDPHPPAAKLFIALGILLFGDNSFGWRIMNVLIGTVLILAVYFAVRIFVNKPGPAILAAFFVATDGLFIVESRIAVIDIYYVTFAVIAFAILAYMFRRNSFGNPFLLIPLGFFIGLSCASKLYIPFVMLSLICLVVGWNTRKSFFKALWAFFVLGMTAACVYFMAFVPHFSIGWWDTFGDFLRYHLVDIPRYEEAVRDATHPYSSKWWTWPFAARPMWYYVEEEAVGRSILAVGNPIVWWGAIVSLLALVSRGFWDNKHISMFIVGGWVIHLLAWAWIERTLFIYHYIPSLLFAFVALGYVLDYLWQESRRTVVVAYLGICAASSLLLIPLWIALPVTFAPYNYVFNAFKFIGLKWL